MEIENFYGCYLLYCTEPKYKGHTYIGFTVDPNRRIKQHNKGVKAGGAWRTNSKGQWDMALIIHGFPNEISALRFEWAWQHPEKSRRLSHVGKKERRETKFQYVFRVAATMLRTGPWSRLPLTIRWLKEEYYLDFHPDFQPPQHMAIAFGPVKAVRAAASKEHLQSGSSTRFKACNACNGVIEEGHFSLQCIRSNCSATFHIQCLAKHFLKADSEHLIPVGGNCPQCNKWVLWGELVRYSNGCYRDDALLGIAADDSTRDSV
ncbi:structure-specific endonuclease subunit slx1-like [Ornithodoros turicata]|uniref:structure-specific endonuclease subunit slx1-like n=1 Tax=Ornithodoros turicata TaxID=34597 RepID=UPI0031399F4A